MGHRNDIAAEALLAQGAAHVGDELEHPQGLLGVFAQTTDIDLQRGRVGDQVGQHRQARRFIERPIVGADRGLQNLGHRLGVAGRFLADIQLQQMETEGLDQVDQVLQLALGQIAIAMTDQRIADQAQVVHEGLGADVTLFLETDIAAVHRALHQDQVAPDAELHDLQLAPVGFLRMRVGPVVEQQLGLTAVFFQARHELGRRPAQANRQRQLIGQRLQPAQVFLIGGHRLHAPGQGGDLGGHAGVAVAVAADPRAEAQETGDLDRLGRLGAIDVVQRLVEVAVDQGDGLE